MSRDNNPRDVLLRPVVSEKSYGLLDEGKYTFVVAPAEMGQEPGGAHSASICPGDPIGPRH